MAGLANRRAGSLGSRGCIARRAGLAELVGKGFLVTLASQLSASVRLGKVAKVHVVDFGYIILGATSDRIEATDFPHLRCMVW